VHYVEGIHTAIISAGVHHAEARGDTDGHSD